MRILSLGLWTILFLSAKDAYSQQPNAGDFNKMVDILPPAPNASAIIKYGGINVNQNTGVPNVQVPLAELKGKEGNIGIALSYASSGIKVDEIASRVGMGWALQAGGVITRTVRGYPDENHQRVAPPALNAQGQLDVSWDAYNFMNNVATSSNAQGYDSEPDLFNYNANGFSGSFVLDKNMQVVQIPYNNNTTKTEINFTGTDWNFKITTTDGTQLYFGGSNAKENTKREQSCGKNFDGYITTAWYLTKIKYLNGSEINFNYTRLEYTYDNGITQNMYYNSGQNVSGPGTCNSHNCNEYTPQSATCINKLKTQGVLLNRISSPGFGEISFVYGTRSDCTDKLVTKITIYKYIDDEIPLEMYHWDFLYDIVNRGATSQPLTAIGITYTPYLKSITQKNNENVSLATYSYDYIDPSGRPARLSYSQDHWGYFNGKGNLSFVPKPSDQQSQLNFPDAKADREPSAEYAKKGMLSKITYPTGGFDLIEYEPNSLYGTEPILSTTIVNDNVTGSGYKATIKKTMYFSINIDQQISLTTICHVNDPNGEFDPVFHKAKYELFEVGGSIYPSVTKYIYPNQSYQDKITVSSGGTSKNYRLEISANGDNITLSAKLEYSVRTGEQQVNKPVAGLRIMRITTKTSTQDNSPMIKRYYYGKASAPNESSLSKENYFIPTYNKLYLTRHLCLQGPLQTAATYSFCEHKALYSSSLSGFNYFQFSPISYEYVTESLGENFENGCTETWFHKVSDAPGRLIRGEYIPNAPKNNYSSLMNGKIKEQTIYKKEASGDLKKVKNTVYDYTTDLRKSVSVFGYVVNRKYGDEISTTQASCPDLVTYTTWYIDSNGNLYEDPAPGREPIYINECRTTVNDMMDAFDVQEYEVMSKWVYTSKSTETLYNDNGDPTMINSADYFYDNDQHLQLTKAETKNSKNETIRTEYKYPNDYSGTAVYDAMLSRNMISPVIQQTQTNTTLNTTLNKLRTKYDLFNSIPQISSVEKALLTNSLEKELDFDKYDDKGNILQLTPKDGVIKSYIWSYSKLLPIAEAINTSREDIAYESFESLPDVTNNWSYTGTVNNSTTALTGKKILQLATGNGITRNGLTVNKRYILSYWSKNGTYSMSNATEIGNPVTGNKIGSWTYYQHTIKPTATSITVSGSGSIDEIRLYPEAALMSTNTYDPMFGVTTKCDVNNRVLYYEYDDLGRLKLIRDQDNYIISRYCYNYAGQPVNCDAQVFYNTEQKKKFVKNNCTSGYTGGVYEYVVEPGKYQSSISQSDANQQAINEINADGQNKANAQTNLCDPIVNTTLTFSSSLGAELVGFKVKFTSVLHPENVYEFTINSSASSGTINATPIPSGVYDIQISKLNNQLWCNFWLTPNGFGIQNAKSASFTNIPIKSNSCTNIIFELSNQL